MILSISAVASTSAQQEFEWYIYKGSPFVVNGGTARVKVAEGMRVGIRPVARSKDYYIVTEDAPKKLFKITKQRATKIAATGKHVKRVIIAGDQPTEKTREVLEDAATQKFDAARFKPLGTVRNEAFGRDGTEAFGVDTKNYQWRIVRDPEYLIQTNKRPIKLRRGDKLGMRFGRPSQGGKIVDLNGMYETVSTAEYDRISADLPVLPKGRWPQTVVTPEMIKEYQINKERQRVRDRNEREKEQRAQEAAARNAEREAKAKREEEQKQRRILDAKENSEIAKQVAEVNRTENARAEQVKEERRAAAGLKDEDLRNMKAGTMKPVEEAIDEEEVDDDSDFGDDLEGDVTRTSDTQKEERAAENDVERQKVEARKKAERNSLRMADAFKILKDGLADDLDGIKKLQAEFRAATAALKAAKTDEEREAIVVKWEKRAAGEDQGADEAAAEEQAADNTADAAGDGSEVEEEDPDAEEEDPDADPDAEEEDPDAVDDQADDEDFEEEDPDADPDAEEEDPEADPDAEEEDPDADPDAGEDGDADFEEDDEDFEEEDPDAEEEDPDADPDAEEEDPDADPDAEEEDPDAAGGGDQQEDDEDFDAAADAEDLDDLEDPDVAEDSQGIADALRDNPDAQDFDDDEGVDELGDVEEEDIGKEPSADEEEAPPAKKPEKKAEKPAPKDEGSEEDPLDFEEEGADDADAKVDMPKPAGVKDTQTAEDGDLLTFHDDGKMKRRFLLVKAEPSKQNDRIIEYTLWDFDSKPETYRKVRVNEARGQNILQYADKVGQVTPKEFNEALNTVDSLELDKTAIKS